MPCSIYRPSSRLSSAFDELQLELVALDRAWTCERERSGLRHAAGDLRHHVCAALVFLDDVEPGAPGAPGEPRTPGEPGVARYDQLDGATRVLAHEAFLAVLAVGQLLRRASEDGLAASAAIEAAARAVEHVLDELTPVVSRADDALRRVLLDDASLEQALAGVARAP
jgi:hypothetical protein